MDSSKLPQGSDECSSNESGWTTYIASPGQEDDHDDDDQDSSKDEEQRNEEDAGSDDSMTSDASSGPSNPFRHLNKQLGCKHSKNYIERKNGGKKEQKHDEKIKAAKDKKDSAARSRKK